MAKFKDFECSAVVLLLVCLFSYPARSESFSQLLGYAYHDLKAADLGRMDTAEAMSITVRVNATDEKAAALDAFLADLYSPESANYQKFLTPEEFGEKFGPSAEDRQEVVDYLKANGLAIDSIEPNGFFIHAHANVKTLESALQVEMHHFMVAKRDSNETVIARGTAVEPVIPARLEKLIGAIHGLKPHFAQPHFRKANASALAASGPAGSAPEGSGLAPADILKAYGMNSIAADGAGQTLAVVEYDAYDPSDIAAYAKAFGIKAPALKNELVDGFPGTVQSPDAQVEVSLDIELILGVAPGASKILVYEGMQDTDQEYLDVPKKIANDNIAKIVSISWGTTEDDATNGASAAIMQSENTVFKQMAAQGQTVFAASGDSGAFTDAAHASTPYVSDPASQPYVTGVGGTKITLKSGAYGSETTWLNDANGKAETKWSANSSGSGGGISKYWPLPSYQAKIGTTANQGSAKFRMVPDVAFNADPNSGYGIYVGGQWGTVGGTSAAAPAWAGFVARVNQERLSKKLPVLGFANPALYQVGASAAYAQAFHDITSSSNGEYKAVKGYDLATGLGTINAGLFAELASAPAAAK